MHEKRSNPLNISATDVSGQKTAVVEDVPRDATVGEIVKDLLDNMNLPKNDPNGRPLTYHARLEREGRHLHDSEVVDDSLQTQDKIVLQPNVDAGGSS